jgi:hypothetical protein
MNFNIALDNQKIYTETWKRLEEVSKTKFYK